METNDYIGIGILGIGIYAISKFKKPFDSISDDVGEVISDIFAPIPVSEATGGSDLIEDVENTDVLFKETGYFDKSDINLRTIDEKGAVTTYNINSDDLTNSQLRAIRDNRYTFKNDKLDISLFPKDRNDFLTIGGTDYNKNKFLKTSGNTYVWKKEESYFNPGETTIKKRIGDNIITYKGNWFQKAIGISLDRLNKNNFPQEIVTKPQETTAADIINITNKANTTKASKRKSSSKKSESQMIKESGQVSSGRESESSFTARYNAIKANLDKQRG